MSSQIARSLSAFLLLASALTATPIHIAATWAADTFSFSYISGPSNLLLERIVIDLSSTRLTFDSDPGAFSGSGSSSLLSSSPLPLDGSRLLTMNFAGFQPGMDFIFTADADQPHTPPPVAPECGSGQSQYTCFVAQMIYATAYAMWQMTQEPMPFDKNGALATFEFSAPGIEVSPLTGAFFTELSGNTITTRLDVLAEIPEPSGTLLWITGLASLALFRSTSRYHW